MIIFIPSQCYVRRPRSDATSAHLCSLCFIASILRIHFVENLQWQLSLASCQPVGHALKMFQVVILCASLKTAVTKGIFRGGHGGHAPQCANGHK